MIPQEFGASLGSPPRVRGKDSIRITEKGDTRITPACAGKRQGFLALVPGCRDHPRVCGEKTLPSTVAMPWEGSPPRVRGKAPETSQYLPRAGITPACAGKRPECYLSDPRTRDHPRVCGEKNQGGHTMELLTGSPPRVRGKGGYYRRPGGRLGITPACAGKRSGRCTMRFFCGDHPRVCGEKHRRAT